eukprot:scaffold7761_cov286-Pinguiococcus_pyrenoidosus.AAC.1
MHAVMCACLESSDCVGENGWLQSGQTDSGSQPAGGELLCSEHCGVGGGLVFATGFGAVFGTSSARRCHGCGAGRFSPGLCKGLFPAVRVRCTSAGEAVALLVPAEALFLRSCDMGRSSSACVDGLLLPCESMLGVRSNDFLGILLCGAFALAILAEPFVLLSLAAAAAAAAAAADAAAVLCRRKEMGMSSSAISNTVFREFGPVLSVFGLGVDFAFIIELRLLLSCDIGRSSSTLSDGLPCCAGCGVCCGRELAPPFTPASRRAFRPLRRLSAALPLALLWDADRGEQSSSSSSAASFGTPTSTSPMNGTLPTTCGGPPPSSIANPQPRSLALASALTKASSS